MGNGAAVETARVIAESLSKVSNCKQCKIDLDFGNVGGCIQGLRIGKLCFLHRDSHSVLKDLL